jgi:hypothetical protein
MGQTLANGPLTGPVDRIGDPMPLGATGRAQMNRSRVGDSRRAQRTDLPSSGVDPAICGRDRRNRQPRGPSYDYCAPPVAESDFSAMGERTAGIRRRLGGFGGYRWVAVAFVVISIGFLSAILITPAGWRWWLQVHRVRGIEAAGTVSYAYGGLQYSLTDQDAYGQPAYANGPRNVYLIPTDPSNATLTSPLTSQVLDWVTTVGMMATAGAFMTVGSIRKRRVTRALEAARGPTPRQTFGEGLDEDFVAQLLDRQRRGT